MNIRESYILVLRPQARRESRSESSRILLEAPKKIPAGQCLEAHGPE